MKGHRKDYAILGFQWEVLAMIVSMWSKANLGVDIREELGDEALKTVLDDDFCRLVALRFRQHWSMPKVVDPDRQERFAKLLVEIDDMVEEAFMENAELHEQLQRRCQEEGYDLDDMAAAQSPVLARTGTADA
jgi:hypothetical protein